MPEATRIIPIFPEMETTASFPSASTTRLEVGLIASDGAAGITRVQHLREKRSAV